MSDDLIDAAARALDEHPMLPRVDVGEPGRADYLERFNRRSGVTFGCIEYQHAGTLDKPRRGRELQYAIDRLRAHPAEIEAAKEHTRKVSL